MTEIQSLRGPGDDAGPGAQSGGSPAHRSQGAAVTKGTASQTGADMGCHPRRLRVSASSNGPGPGGKSTSGMHG